MIIYLYLYIFCRKNKHNNQLYKNPQNLLMTRKLFFMAHQLVVANLTVMFHYCSPCGTDTILTITQRCSVYISKVVTKNVCYLS